MEAIRASSSLAARHPLCYTPRPLLPSSHRVAPSSHVASALPLACHPHSRVAPTLSAAVRAQRPSRCLSSLGRADPRPVALIATPAGSRQRVTIAGAVVAATAEAGSAESEGDRAMGALVEAEGGTAHGRGRSESSEGSDGWEGSDGGEGNDEGEGGLSRKELRKRRQERRLRLMEPEAVQQRRRQQEERVMAAMAPLRKRPANPGGRRKKPALEGGGDAGKVEGAAGEAGGEERKAEGVGGGAGDGGAEGGVLAGEVAVGGGEGQVIEAKGSMGDAMGSEQQQVEVGDAVEAMRVRGVQWWKVGTFRGGEFEAQQQISALVAQYCPGEACEIFVPAIRSPQHASIMRRAAAAMEEGGPPPPPGAGMQRIEPCVLYVRCTMSSALYKQVVALERVRGFVGEVVGKGKYGNMLPRAIPLVELAAVVELVRGKQAEADRHAHEAERLAAAAQAGKKGAGGADTQEEEGQLDGEGEGGEAAGVVSKGARMRSAGVAGEMGSRATRGVAGADYDDGDDADAAGASFIAGSGGAASGVSSRHDDPRASSSGHGRGRGMSSKGRGRWSRGGSSGRESSGDEGWGSQESEEGWTYSGSGSGGGRGGGSGSRDTWSRRGQMEERPAGGGQGRESRGGGGRGGRQTWRRRVDEREEGEGRVGGPFEGFKDSSR
ncbi:unnamed protein product [Closterium sp. NIES-65]|nr:unnamed protein product [Closterium sp. NIES-65]